MERRLLLESTPGQQRLAVMEDGRLVELHVRRALSAGLVGLIALGRVMNLAPGINAAFVDIGEEKNAYLSAADCLKPNGKPAGINGRIDACLRPGQEILVQVIKEPGGMKGCRVSMQPTLPGRMCVLRPYGEGASVSRKLEFEEERERLKRLAEECLAGTGCGAILRTAAEGATREAIRDELGRLQNVWEEIARRASTSIAPARLYGEEDLATVAVRDLLNGEVVEVASDDAMTFERLRGLMRDVEPERRAPVRFHEGAPSLFDVWRIDHQLERATRRLIWLDSGGSIVVDETEAMTVIDVNTGKFIGKKNLRETVLKINCEAAEEIARQLRLREIGGIVVVDFIDMDAEEDRQALLDALQTALRRDRNQTHALGFTQLGLMEITRKKTRMPLSRQLLRPCAACGGSGFEPSFETTACAALREIGSRAKATGQKKYRLTAIKPAVECARSIGAPEGVEVEYVVDPRMSAGEFNVE